MTERSWDRSPVTCGSGPTVMLAVSSQAPMSSMTAATSAPRSTGCWRGVSPVEANSSRWSISSSMRAVARRARAIVVNASDCSSTSVSSISSDSDRDVRGFLRSWLTWPAKASNRAFDRSRRALTSLSRREASSSSSTSTTRSASIARSTAVPETTGLTSSS